jgi:hypothetical protein
MTAKGRLAAILLTTAMAALATGASAGTAAGAAATWTVTPGGSITLASSAMALRDNATGTTLSCTASSGSAAMNSSANNQIGTITALSFTGCTGPQGQPFTITMTRLPFFIGARTYNASTGVTSGIIYRVAGELSGPSCTASLEGPDSIHTARPRFTYRNSTGKLKLPGTGTMQITNVTGCTGLFSNGPTPDPASLTGTYTITPDKPSPAHNKLSQPPGHTMRSVQPPGRLQVAGPAITFACREPARGPARPVGRVVAR